MVAASELVHALQVRHGGREWICFPELRLGSGYGGKWEQRIDAWAMSCYPSAGLQSISYEVKVSRSDFLHELAQPEKRRAAMEMSNLFYFVAPVDIIKLDELPSDCGLIEYEDGKLHTKCRASFRDREALPWRFLASVGRRILNAPQLPGYIDLPRGSLYFQFGIAQQALFARLYAEALAEAVEGYMSYAEAAKVVEGVAEAFKFLLGEEA